MSRTATKTQEPVTDVVLNQNAVAHIEQAQDDLAMATLKAGASAKAMALQMGYEGTLSVGALEDEIRFYQRRTVEAILETGKRLLVLKELTPHGEFAQRVEMLGFSYPTAARFMLVAKKTAKSLNLRDLSTQVKSASAFLELVTHDDDALESLKDMDDIERMSASELRATLRQAKVDNQFIAEKRDKEMERADKAEKELRGPGPKVRSLEERVGDFSKTVDGEQTAVMDGLLNIDQQIKALDAWYTDWAVNQPDYDPSEAVDMPVEVLALVKKLRANLDSIASSVGGLQHLFAIKFNDDLESVTTYQMQEPVQEPAQALAEA